MEDSLACANDLREASNSAFAAANSESEAANLASSAAGSSAPAHHIRKPGLAQKRGLGAKKPSVEPGFVPRARRKACCKSQADHQRSDALSQDQSPPCSSLSCGWHPP